MKRSVFIFAAFFLLCIVSCLTQREYIGLITYIYENSGTRDIKITAYAPIFKDKGWVEGKIESYDIPAGHRLTIQYETRLGSIKRPFQLYEVYNGKDSIVISNGVRYVVERKSEDNILYKLDSYEKTQQSEYETMFKYNFTDAYFQNGMLEK